MPIVQSVLLYSKLCSIQDERPRFPLWIVHRSAISRREQRKGVRDELRALFLCSLLLSKLSSMLFNVRNIIEHIEDTMGACHANDGDGGVGGGIEEIPFQPKHFGDVGVHYAAVRKY